MPKGLAVEGGGTKTIAVVFHGVEILGVGMAGSSNLVEVGRDRAERALREAIGEALSEASTSMEEVQESAFALAGVGDSPGFTREVVELVKSIREGAVIMNDGEAAVRLAHLFEDGGAVVAGTGSVGYIQRGGSMRRLGGWGWFFGDEGSASYIGKRAITMATRALDGLLESRLPGELERFYGMEIRDIIEMFTRRPDKSRIASFAKVVDRLAKEGDPTAVQIMNETVEYISAVLERMKREVTRVAGVGGVFNSAYVKERLKWLRTYRGYQAVVGCVVSLRVGLKEEDRDNLLTQLEKFMSRLGARTG
ncbi:hypothetical protein GWK48_02720 [Metallosphaera tengchongensis]|uniref:ATPase BadF/BadG/BcrA/BcrD type domain-containing protein n=1 Tax=Metallosphaera tengchongensis TaxID=1532350 RepID=A0A6N0NWC4_9CREN|nr:BadF/BadG/BcrA/BcrD ATPase family protein [Metallosphaera tengchongensis]QKQ99449.1 hypothetical protein GWK48_02720 [Metallosphaera tengchongensis]